MLGMSHYFFRILVRGVAQRSATCKQRGGRRAEIVFAQEVFVGQNISAANKLSRLAVSRCMTRRAECDQILFRIVPRMAAELFVMDFQIRHGAAQLTLPVIATENLLP